MGKILLFRNRKKQKAVTLVETVVSLSIILIVSIAAVSVSVYSANSFRIANTKRFFNHEMTTISEYYLYYDVDDFKKAFHAYTGQTIDGFVDSTFYLDSSLKYLPNSENSEFYMVLDFNEDNLKITSFSNKGSNLGERSVSK